MVSELYALYCDKIRVADTSFIGEISKPGEYVLLTNHNPGDQIMVASASCEDSQKLQYQRWHGENFGVAVIREKGQVRVRAYERALFRLSTEELPTPFYIVVKGRK